LSVQGGRQPISYSSDIQARDNTLHNELPCQHELVEVSCIETIVPAKQQI